VDNFDTGAYLMDHALRLWQFRSIGKTDQVGFVSLSGKGAKQRPDAYFGAIRRRIWQMIGEHQNPVTV